MINFTNSFPKSKACDNPPTSNKTSHYETNTYTCATTRKANKQQSTGNRRDVADIWFCFGGTVDRIRDTENRNIGLAENHKQK